MGQEYQAAGKFIRQKRKAAGFKTQKRFIQVLEETDRSVNCSESYISLIESGAKSPSVHLLDAMATVLGLSRQEKGQLLLSYKRVPSDFEFAVRSNLDASLRMSNIDRLRQQYQEDPQPEHIQALIRALVLDDRREEALELLKSAPHFSSDFIALQYRTAQMASLSGNYDFALQGFRLALDNCPTDAIRTQSDIWMQIGIAYFSRGLLQQYIQPQAAFEDFKAAKDAFEKTLEMMPDDPYTLDEYARCLYHVAESLAYFYKNGKADGNILIQIHDYYQQSLLYYQRVLFYADEGDLPEKALKEATYFHAYLHSKLGRFEEAQVLINSLLIHDRNWLTCFLRAGHALMCYEAQKHEDRLEECLTYLELAIRYEPETMKTLIQQEKDRELKTLWELKGKKLSQWVK